MLGDSPIVAFIPSADLDRSRSFYETTLGMKVLEQDPFALSLEAPGSTVRVTKVGPFTPFPFTIFGWNVEEIAVTVAGLKSRGIEFQHFGMPNQDADGIWTSPSGARIAWFRDPDGNTLSVTQF